MTRGFIDKEVEYTEGSGSQPASKLSYLGERSELARLLFTISPKWIAHHADVFRGSPRVPAPLTSAEPKDKFLSLCSQISPGDHMQIIGDPIGGVEVKVWTSQTHTYKFGRV